MKRKRLWDEVAKLVEEGQIPIVEFPKSAKVIMPKRRPGRPREKPLGARKHHGYNLLYPSGRVMRCRAFGCGRDLKKGATTIVCSERCAQMLREYCETTLAVLNGTLDARDYPPHFRTRVLRSGRRTRKECTLSETSRGSTVRPV